MSTADGDKRDVFFFVPHTHWEGAVFKTREAYLDMGLPNIVRALRLLEKHPHYRFALDQVCYVKPFLERYPHEAEAFQRLVDEGRLAIVGGTDTMLDVNMPGGESFVRQVLYGKGYFREALGVDVTVGWQLDTFGHHAQMPQLLKLGGFRSFWFFRGVPGWDTPAEFDWEGLDGSRIPAYWLPRGYAITYGSPPELEDFRAFMVERYGQLDSFTRGPDCATAGRVGPAGADVCLPEEHVPESVAQFNADAGAPFELRLATPGEYEAFVTARRQRASSTGDTSDGDDWPVVRGELNPIFQGIYSSRIELKQLTREIEVSLTTAEKLGVALRHLDLAVDDEILWQAWEPTLFNQAHDLMSGVMTDPVYDDTLAGFDLSRRLADREVDERLRRYAGSVDTRGKGVPLVVYNPLGWTRTDVTEATVSLGGAPGIDLRDSAGSTVPFQAIEVLRDDSGMPVQVRLAFAARDVPALGHCVYRLAPSHQPLQDPQEEPAGDGPISLDGGPCRLALDPSGAITSLVLAEDGWEALKGPGNVVAREPDRGDLWELYRPLDGGSRIAMQEPHGLPAGDGVVLSTDGEGDPGTVCRGVVYSEYSVTRPYGASGEFGTRVRVYADLGRVDIRTRIRNEEEFVRYRALFPTAIQGDESVHEIPFGAISRPNGIEFPAQNWVEYGDGEHGLTLTNRGLPGHNAADDTLMLSLCRSSSIVAYGFGGGYEPGMSSASGLELGRELTFDYGLVPHLGDWRDTRAWRHGMEKNHPLLTRVASSSDGVLASRWGLLEIDHPHVAVSTLKSSRDDRAVLRVYDAGGQGAEAVAIRLGAPLVQACEADLMEDPIGPCDVSGQTIRFGLKPWEIKTFRLAL